MKTALFDSHLSLHAKIVDFCGWEMPLYYTSMTQEHLNVRKNGGIFDLSHMGLIYVEGPQAEKFLNYLCTNEIANKKPGTATYTLLCSEQGACLEDLIVYRENEERFFLVVNACNRQKVLTHLHHYAPNYTVTVYDRFQEEGILAVQGLAAPHLFSEQFPEVKTLSQKHFISARFENKQIILAATGYTGEKGVEIFVPNELIVPLWDHLLEGGRKLGIQPAGLGARDTLRLEMGYALYGHEIDETIFPTESIAAWTVQLSKTDFLGKKPLIALENSGKKRKEVGVILQEKGIARAGYPVFKEGKAIGKVTSGAFAPSLNKSIALVLLERNLHEGDSVDIEIREKKIIAEIVKLPFYSEQR